MPKPQASHQTGPDGEHWERKVVALNLSAYPKDVELLDWVADYLGCSRSEAQRTAIRLLAAQLAQVSK